MGKYKWDVQARFPRTKKNTKPWSLEKIEKAYRFIDVLKKTRDLLVDQADRRVAQVVLLVP